MHDLFLKDARDSYSAQMEEAGAAIATLTGTLRDSAGLKKTLQEQKKLLAATGEAIRTLKKELFEARAEKKALEDAATAVRSLEEKLSHNDATIRNGEEILRETEAAAAQALRAEGTMKENSAQYIRHEAAGREHREAGHLLAGLETQAHELDTIKETSKRLELARTEISASLDSAREELPRKRADVAGQEETLAAAEAKLALAQAGLAAIGTKLGEYSAVEKDLDSACTELNRSRQAITGGDAALASLTAQLAGRDAVVAELERLTAATAALPDLKEQQHARNITVAGLQSRLAELEEAREKLADGLCPFFQEPCGNLAAGNDRESYFTGKRRLLEEDLRKREEDLQQLETAIRTMEEHTATMATLRGTLAQLEEAERAREKTGLTRQLEMERATRCADTMRHILSGIAGTPLPREEEPDKALDDFKKKMTSLRHELEDTQARMDEYSALRNREQERLAELRQRLEILEKQITDDEARLAEADRELLTFAGSITQLEQKLLPLPALREQRRILERELETLAEATRLYTANKAIAAELENHRAKAKRLGDDLSRLALEREKLTQDLETARPAHDPERLQGIEADLEKLEERRSALDREEGTLNESVHSLKSALAEEGARRKEIDALKERQDALRRKLELADRFRTCIKDTGKRLTGRYLRHIEQLATGNFRRITGRAEQIRWINSEKESYALYLCREEGMEQAVPMSNLSGGEQVAVALSLRAAMASFLTRSNFAIFDEPTINLDQQRRAALAENLNAILKDLDQALIVTHDDTFREMAQSVLQF